jgi:prepilin-type processing-associated H-X9-DG protein
LKGVTKAKVVQSGIWRVNSPAHVIAAVVDVVGEAATGIAYLTVGDDRSTKLGILGLVGAERRIVDVRRQGWTREILPYAEDTALRGLYPNPNVPIHDPSLRIFRETFVPIFHCPSDLQSEVIIPAHGPPNNHGIDDTAAQTDTTSARYRTGSYRGNAGRGDGFTTWYLYEDIPPANGSPSSRGTGLTKNWRGPLHAVVIKGGPAVTGKYELRPESFRTITDGSSKTLLAAESTKIDYNRRRTFWAYTFGTFILSQPVPQPRVFMGEYRRCESMSESSTPNTPLTGTAGRVCKSSWFSFHPGGMNAIFCDGSGTFLSFDMDLNVFAAMGSIAGGESETGP